MTARWMRQTASMAAVLASVAAAHNFPYVPTQILMPDTCFEPSMPCDGSDIAYVVTQNDDGVAFRQLNFSATINLDIKLDTVTDTLPFLEDKPATTAFGATRTANGTLLVYAGDCDGGTGDVWSYNQQPGQWVKREMGDDGVGPRGPYFLGGTLAFSSTLAPTMDQPTIYTYGGMCVKPDTDADEWQQDANYTKSMLSIEPTSENLDTGYTLSVASNSGPRTPIAGFTFTPLTPSMTNKSGIVTQQASYVLLGGHTSQAFINMSTAAVWNLPAESWTYVNIQAPDNERDGTELALTTRAAGVDNVYSRSGHTAVLSEDGGSVVVLGGWVGDVDTPAEPQLAVLEMSETYDSWQWKIPDDQPSGNGIYGHGSAVLPGNVMMVYGGWEISSSKKRQASGTTSPRFLNLTSMSWTSSYSNPSTERPSKDDPDAPKEDGHPDTKKLGLGLGLGFGLAILIAAIIIGLYWYKKQHSHRASRDQAVRALSQDPNQYLEHDEMLERDDDPWGPGGWYSGGQDPYQNGERSLGYETLRGNRGGAFSGPLPGLHIPRKPLSRQQRGGYVPTAQRPTSFVAVPGQIHPIYEDEEEESYHQNRRNQEVQTPTSEAPSDPFLTPTQATAPVLFPPPGSRGSSTPSPEGRRHDPEVQDWVSDVDAADAMLARMNTRGQGRISPTRRNSHRSAALRDDESRSGSNLSESARSVTESLKGRKPNPLVPMALFSGSRDVEHQKPGSSSSSSYNTARSSFGALQAEGPSLLIGRNAPSPNYDDDEPPASPSKSKPRRGWLGSLRRVFSNSESTTPTSSREDMFQRHHEMGIGGSDYEPGLVGLRGELLRRKQGRQDWEEGPAGESDWDIERAVEQRLVQVMFTVPRERLRVVNGDDEEGEEDEREGMVQPLSAVLVDPEVDSQRTESNLTEKHRFEEEDITREKPQEGPKEPEHGEEEFNEKHPEMAEQHHHQRQESRDLTHHRPRALHIPPPDDHHTHSRNVSQEHDATFLTIDTQPPEPRFSHETDEGRPSSGVLMEAQAMPLTRERPRTRVLQMVDSFETMSREGSPTRSI